MVARKPGRPTKFTPESAARVIQAIRLGSTLELAAQYAGVSYNTLLSWIKRGQAESSGAYVEFVQTLKNVEGETALGWLAKIEQAANNGSWQAAAWKLERRYPHMYSRNVQETQHSGEVKIRVEYADGTASETDES